MKLTIFIATPLLVLVAASGLIFAGYPKPKTTFVSLSELTSNPQKYDGQPIKTVGIRVLAFEAIALGESIEKRDGATYLKQPTLWLETASVTNRRDCFKEEPLPFAEFCTVNVEGLFESGGDYGHLGQYKFQISAIPQNPIRLNLWKAFCALQGKTLSIGPACVDASRRAVPL